MPNKKSKQIRVAINGFGRIGRAVFKLALENPNLKIVAINDLTDTATLAHLLKHDTVYGKYAKEVSSDTKNIYINKVEFPVLAIKDPAKLPWKKYKVDVVLECTGLFRTQETAKLHIKAGAKKVIISAPGKGKPEIPTYLLGVNADQYKGEPVISMASCTTNCISPVVKIIDENFGVEKALLTTIHSYTSTQNLIDGPCKDLRRARAAAYNIIPTSTGAAIASTKVLPQLTDKFDGMAVRVPTICGSLSDLVIQTKTKTTVEQVNAVITKASQNKNLKNILQASNDPIVSSDIIGTTFSSIVDLSCTQVVMDDMLKIFAWYDNEWGYSSRLVDMVEVVMK